MMPNLGEAVASNVNILIVDDRPDNLVAMEAVLARSDYNLVQATSGYEALVKAMSMDFAVILLDVQMPGMDGFEAARALKQQPRSKDVPIIFVTAINKSEQHICHGYEAGAVDYLFKPFDPFVLQSKVAVFAELFRRSECIKHQAELIHQAEVRDRMRCLAEMEVANLQRYRLLADAIPHSLWRTDAQGRVEYVNRVWTVETGLTLEDSQGEGWQTIVQSDDLIVLTEKWQEACRHGTDFIVECRFRTQPGGHYRWHLVKGVREYASDRDSAWLVTSTDIEDRKRAEFQLWEAKLEADRANRAKSNFLANMSHEIRTPLGAMLGFAELLLNPELGQGESVDSILTIKRNGQQLLRIIDEILDISKIEAGQMVVEQIPVSLKELLCELQSLLNIQAIEKNLRLVFKTDGRLPERIQTDPTRLRQILTNVVGNAIKFSAHGTVSLVARFQPSESGDETGTVIFEVADTGPGLTEHQTRRLFQPFVQVDSSTTRKFGGTGLGLALSRRLAEALGGQVQLKSTQPGHGSCFEIQIPSGSVAGVSFVESLQVTDEVVKREAQERGSILLGLRVLLVEDSPDNQILISRFLKMAGAEVDLAGNGVEGVRMALEGQYDIVIMDIQMPLLDGYEATGRLRSQGYGRPIVALTAHAMKEEREKCLKVGCDAHLTKPIDRKTLINGLKPFVSTARAQLTYSH